MINCDILELYVCVVTRVFFGFGFFFQAEDGILDAQESRGLGDVYKRQENTPYSLEPNCKESPGGLRDLQIILWVANAANLGKNWDDLAKNGLATPFEVKQIKSNEATLNLIRARLHS